MQQLAVGAQSANAAIESLAELRQLSAKLDALRTAQAAAEQAAAQRTEQLLAASAAQTAALSAQATALNCLLATTREEAFVARLQQALVLLTQENWQSVCGNMNPFEVAAVVQARLRGETSIPYELPFGGDIEQVCTVLHGLTGRKPEAFRDYAYGHGRWLLSFP